MRPCTPVQMLLFCDAFPTTVPKSAAFFSLFIAISPIQVPALLPTVWKLYSNGREKRQWLRLHSALSGKAAPQVSLIHLWNVSLIISSLVETQTSIIFCSIRQCCVFLVPCDKSNIAIKYDKGERCHRCNGRASEMAHLLHSRQPEFESWNPPQGGRRESPPQNCHALWHVQTQS